MLKHGDLIKKVKINTKKEVIIDLKGIYPLEKIESAIPIKGFYSIDDYNFYKIEDFSNLDNITARYIKVISSSLKNEVRIYCGLGYIAIENNKLSDKFLATQNWGGGDGIYSFNLENLEYYDQKDDKTLFVFGDTFVGNIENYRRVEPTAFINNTFAYYKNGKLDFKVKRNEVGAYESFFKPSLRLLKRGYIAENLTKYYGKDIDFKPYCSEYNPIKDVELVFSLHGIHDLNKIEIINYFDSPNFGINNEKRGVKTLDIYYKENDIDEYRFYKKVTLNEYSLKEEKNNIEVNFKAQYVKFLINFKENFAGSINEEDKVVGLKKVYFYDNEGPLFDVETTSNSEFFSELAKAWLWLQDGVIINNNLYIYPVMIEEDLNGIEGYEFKMNGVSQIKVPLKHKKLDFNNYEVREAPFYRLDDDKEYIGPSAIFYNHERYINGDGYIYFYCYYNERKAFLRHLIVGRILPSEIDDLNNIRYFDGKEWNKDILKAKSLLTHVSCEMSVQTIESGENKGKYLAIFQYDTNSNKVAYAIGETLVGPFSEPRIVYIKDLTEFDSPTTYAYNAKSHLHLSSKNKIVVSFNLNDMSMAKNKSESRIYHPRFLNLMDTSKDD